MVDQLGLFSFLLLKEICTNHLYAVDHLYAVHIESVKYCTDKELVLKMWSACSGLSFRVTVPGNFKIILGGHCSILSFLF